MEFSKIGKRDVTFIREMRVKAQEVKRISVSEAVYFLKYKKVRS